MSHPKGLHPGTIWRKCDFQCHTPRDRAWASQSPTTDVDRRAWAKQFVEACAQRDISVVAVTDHHDVELVSYVQEAATASNVTVFPGVEITCKDDAQCIAIFDPSCGRDVLDKFLAKLPSVLPAKPEEAKGCDVPHADVTVQKLFDTVSSDEHLRNACIVLPHFSDPDAHKSLNKDGHHPRFAQLQCDGVYVERSFDQLENTTREKAYGKIDEWGRRRRAIIVTGDNRSETYDRLGAHPCWIKLGEDTIEGVRQALLADEARISYATSPGIPTDRIVELKVSATLLGPDPVLVSFNDGFTALIGGRGSGKTALLEYLRFGLGRSEGDLPGGESGPKREREAQLIDDTLAGGYVELVLEREGLRESWRRDLSSRETIVVTGADGNLQNLTLEAASRRFPARAFSQKGLSTTMNDPATAADQITGIAAAEELEQRRKIDRAIRNAKRAVTTALQQLASAWQVRLQGLQVKSHADDVRGRLNAVSQKLKSEGISPDSLQLIGAAPTYGRAGGYLNTVKETIETDRTRLIEFASDVLSLETETFPDIDKFEEIAELEQKMLAAKARISTALTDTVVLLDELELNRSQAFQHFSTRNEKYQLAYAAAKSEQATHSALIQESERLSKELAVAEAEELRANSNEAKSTGAEAAFTAARTQLSALLHERRKILEAAANQVADKANGMLKARMKRDPEGLELAAAVSRLLEGGRIHDLERKCDEWVRSILNDGSAWETLCSGILSAYEAKVMSDSPAEPGTELASKLQTLFFGDTLTTQQTNRVYQNLSDATVGEILSAVPRDYIVLTYMADGQPTAFEKASPGQQASALLQLLLNQSAGTLIIDQPEDDLDNRVLMQIVQLIRTSKGHRQLIFATHNPNIVVNGDADKVVVLDTRSGDSREHAPRIKVVEDGAIETPAVREAVTTLMEGGQEAFDLRGRKYRFEQ